MLKYEVINNNEISNGKSIAKATVTSILNKPTFNKLSLTGRYEVRKWDTYTQVYAEAKCTCGNTDYFQYSQIKRGRKKACSLCNRKLTVNNNARRRNAFDGSFNTGDKYGHWTIVEDDSMVNPISSTRIKAICDCGKEKYVHLYNLKKGVSKSCGCGGKIKKSVKGLNIIDIDYSNKKITLESYFLQSIPEVYLTDDEQIRAKYQLSRDDIAEIESIEYIMESVIVSNGDGFKQWCLDFIKRYTSKYDKLEVF